MPWAFSGTCSFLLMARQRTPAQDFLTPSPCGPSMGFCASCSALKFHTEYWESGQFSGKRVPRFYSQRPDCGPGPSSGPDSSFHKCRNTAPQRVDGCGEELGLGLSHGHSAISVWISLPLDASLNKHCSSLLDFLIDPCFSTWSHTSSAPLHVFRTQGWLHNVWGPAGAGKSTSPFFGPAAPGIATLVPGYPGPLDDTIRLSPGVLTAVVPTPTLPACTKAGQVNSRAWPTNTLGRGQQPFWGWDGRRGADKAQELGLGVWKADLTWAEAPCFLWLYLSVINERPISLTLNRRWS